MDGVTILNTYMAWTTLDTVYLLIWGFVIIVISIFLVLYGPASENSTISILLGVVGACVFMLLFHYYPKTKHIQATLDQSVSWAELAERYEVIRVDGRIITMIEREKGNDSNRPD